MRRFGCLFGTVLMIFAFVAMFALVVFPVLPGLRDNALLMQFQAAINCPPGNTFENEFDTYRPRPGETVEAATGYCIDEEGTRTQLSEDQQLRMFAIYGGIFVVPFCIGLFIVIGTVGSAVRKPRQQSFQTADGTVVYSQQTYDLDNADVIRQMTGIDVRRTDQGVTISMPGMNEPMVVNPKAGGGGSGDLSERLRQIETARNQGLISQEEYDRLRKAILDDMA